MAVKPVLGLDIGSNSVKLCQLKPTKQGWQLLSLGVAPLPHEAIVDGALMNSGAVVDAIMELVATNKVREKNAAVSISGHSVIIKKIPMSQMSMEELEESIRWEAEQFIPFDIEDVNIDVQIVREETEMANQMEVVLVAAKKDMINDYTSVVVEAGLNPLICDVDVFAVQNMFEHNYPNYGDNTIAIVNIGASNANINVVAGGIPTFTRDISFGGNQFTEELQKELGISYDEAETVKHGGPDADAIANKNNAERILEGVSETFSMELQRSLEFFSATSTERPLSKIFLSGGSSHLKSLQTVMSHKLGLPIEVIDPFKNINLDHQGVDREFIKNVGHVAGVAVGLAMRAPGDRYL